MECCLVDDTSPERAFTDLSLGWTIIRTPNAELNHTVNPTDPNANPTNLTDAANPYHIYSRSPALCSMPGSTFSWIVLVRYIHTYIYTNLHSAKNRENES